METAALPIELLAYVLVYRKP
ncbi:hypothetical protein XAP6164_1740017 [Xanthomonas phaseoli pv. phaseoli]|nr:hypothetical protein XAP6164_1740017 [Xanthomonas phaseoli pv. phaseoli]